MNPAIEKNEFAARFRVLGKTLAPEGAFRYLIDVPPYGVVHLRAEALTHRWMLSVCSNEAFWLSLVASVAPMAKQDFFDERTPLYVLQYIESETAKRSPGKSAFDEKEKSAFQLLMFSSLPGMGVSLADLVNEWRQTHSSSAAAALKALNVFVDASYVYFPAECPKIDRLFAGSEFWGCWRKMLASIDGAKRNLPKRVWNQKTCRVLGLPFQGD